MRVNEVASNIGQGWNLTAGGMITRMQVGEPDDQKPRDGAFNDVNKYPAGYLYSGQNPALGCPIQMTNYPEECFHNKIHIDNIIDSDTPEEQLKCGLYFSYHLAKKIEAALGHGFNVLLSYDEEYCVVRFHQIRINGI